MLHNQNLKIMQNLKSTLLLVAALLFATSCHDYLNDVPGEIDTEESRQNQKGKKDVTTSEDEDSDRPDWAGGNTDENPHIKGNDDSGTTRGGDYGDLYVLRRDFHLDPTDLKYGQSGVPILTEMIIDGVLEYFVQPIDAAGNIIELDQYGEVPEGAPVIEVDFGRLNIVRSPQSVLDQALSEARKVIDYGEGFSLDFCGRLTIWNTVDGVLTVTKTIDSPRESMAMYQEIMNHEFDDKLAALAGSGIDPYMLAASCFAAGSDKTGTVDIDEVVYINGFMDAEGCDPIENENEYDFNNNVKKYFNFEDCACHSIFKYNREFYKDRELIFYNYINGEYVEWKRLSVWQAMEDIGGFTEPWGNGVDFEYGVKGFAMAVDDAVQVLDYVHGNSNIEFAYVAP